MKFDYKTPILVVVLRIYAALSIVSGLIAAAVSISGSPTVAAFCFLVGLGQAVICLGLAECVNFLGKTAYYTEASAQVLERQEKRATQIQAKIPGYGSSADDAWTKAQRGE